MSNYFFKSITCKVCGFGTLIRIGDDQWICDYCNCVQEDA